MIDKSKVYKTRDGREVRIYATDGREGEEVHGAFLTKDGWVPCGWSKSGLWCDGGTDNADLIEVKPRIRREVWVNVYRQDDGYEFATYHDNATDAWSERGDAIVARACLAIDVEEGEGL